MKELIYSKKFPEVDDLGLTTEELFDAMEDAHKRIDRELVYVPIPDKLKGAMAFINQAIAVSERYEYDLDIYLARGGFEVILSFDHQYTFSDVNRLIGKADDIIISAGTRGREFTIVLTYYTHGLYRDGKMCLPDPEE